jgi:heat shock protein HtpX
MGARSRYGDDAQLTRATRLAVLRVGFAAVVTVAAIAMSYAFFIGLKGAVGVHAAWQWGHGWAVGGLVLLALVLAVGAFQRVRVAAGRIRGAELLPDDSRFVGMLARLCALADMPRPRLALVDLPMRNAFVGEAPGQPATIYLSRHAAYELPDDQLEAVLAHELFHVAHGDTALTRRLERIADTAERRAPRFVSDYVLRSVRSLMRQREHAADRAAALLTGRPSSMVAALEACSSDGASVRDADLRAAVALGFVPPRERGFGYPEDTHPTLAKRTEVLARVATTLGSRGPGV